MPKEFCVKEDYQLAKCCRPIPGCSITGYYSHDRMMKVHRSDCLTLGRLDAKRLVPLEWEEILAEPETPPEADFKDLDDVDFAVLEHHRVYGVDYSLKMARMLAIDKQVAFDRHRKLMEMQLLRRVEPRIIQYRKGIVDNRWIKHRNHTYYELTDKGGKYLEHRARPKR